MMARGGVPALPPRPSVAYGHPVGSDDPLIGRAAERAALAALAARPGAGEGVVVLLAGEAGVGKSLLARTVLDDLAIEPLTGVARQEGTPAYGPIVEAIRAVLRSRVDAAALDPAAASHLASLLPELGPAAALTDRATLFDALRSVLALAAADGPLAIVLEDLQWADDATLGLLPALARALQAEPVLLLLAYRSDDVPRGHPIRRLRAELRRDGRLHEIAVAPLDAEATGALLERVLGAPAAPSLRDAIVDRTDGVPFFVTELALALAAGERLGAGPDGLEVRDGGALPLPESVRDAVLLRAAAVSGPAREVLAVAAVAGQSLEPEAVLAIAGADAWPEEPALDAILAPGPHGPLAFRHALVRDAFYDEIPWQRRRALHRDVARRLEDGGAPARVVAEHWAQAREPDRARRAFLAATDAFRAVHAYRDAARTARRALELWGDGDHDAERLDALEALARCAGLAGEPAEAIRAWREAIDGRRREGHALRLGEAQRQLAGALELQGRWDEALATREAAAVAFASAGAAAEAAAERLGAAAHLRSAGSFRAALQVLALAGEDARAAGRVDLEVRIQALTGNVRARMGEGEEGLRLVRAALALALDRDLTTAAAEIFQRLADSLEHGGDYAAAVATYDDAFAFCTTGGVAPTAQLCLACLAAVLRQTGDWERAAALCREVLASPDSTVHANAAAAATLGSILVLRGEREQPRALLLEAFSVGRRTELLAVEVLAVWGLGLLDEAEGAAQGAVDRAHAILERWRQTGEELHYTIAPLRWASTVLAEAGDAAGARASAAALAQIAAGAGHPEAVSALAHALGEVALLEGDAEQAVIELDRSIDLLQGLGAPLERIGTERRAAVALLATGRREEAVERLAGAYRLARRLRARPSVERLARALAGLGEQAERRLSRGQAEQLGQHGLTRREVEVLRALAVGRTNREIAGELFLSTRTVDAHVRNILRKLDCRARADAARRANELGLLQTPAR